MKRRRFSFLHIVSSLIFAAALAVAADLLAAFFSAHIALPVFAGIFLGCAVLLIVFKLSTKWLWLFFSVGIAGFVLVLGAILYSFNVKGAYTVEDNGKAELYGGHTVLVLVPHQDDEILVAGGVIEEYVRYGSQVYLSFYTNGDRSLPGETRLREALAVAESMGVPENNVIFLGYGDVLSNGLHIYNNPNDQLIEHNGHSSTYALAEHPPFNNSSYKRENVVADMKAMLLQIKPDIIICSEYEEHPDHAATSLFFDEAMEQILKTPGNDYLPIILKSPCYGNYFYGVEDFYSENLLSTAPALEGYGADFYDWDNRIRLPVNPQGLSRSIFGCNDYKNFKLHRSQQIPLKSEGSINGDKVFWIRDTHSLSYMADIQVSSGQGELLNNFKIVDNYDLVSASKEYSGCTWTPDASDSVKTATVTLSEASYIDSIRLYDDPRSDINVLNALISFDDGSSIETGPLKPSSATNISVKKADVKSFSVSLLKTEGEGAGLTEIEVFSQKRDYGFNFIKLTDADGNFIYDYQVDKKGKAEYRIYAPGVNSPIKQTMNRDHIYTVTCAKGETEVITVTSEDGKYSDTVVFSNPGRFIRETGPYFEELFRQFFKVNMQQTNTYTLLRTAYNMI